ncbi:hypothetical protein ABIQ69_11610 [Agromyces sp. G08B096]|uniref:Uncharacterized protein n=1 Tax=Agromyces sp. G08B096 TaxID=3156399 RepID=A0AAU7W5I8_9MICO
MKVSAHIRPTSTTELTATGEDLPSARAQFEALIPPGHELIRAHDQKLKAGGVEVHGLIRPDRTEPIEADGPTYEAAVAALQAKVPDGYQLLGITIVS